jgi:hypothetical protein
MARRYLPFTGIDELLFANVSPAAQEWHATRESVRRLKKGVRLWLSTMAKG